MIKTWTQYAERIERHYANEHSKEGNNEDSSCDVCYPPDISIADPTYLNFLNWFKNTYKIRYHTSRTITYYSLARKYPLELQKWIMYVITSIRYSEVQNFQEMLEEVVNQWEETEGFQTRVRRETSESSTGSKNKGKHVEQSSSRIRPEMSGEGSNRRRNNNNRLPRDRDLLVVETLEAITRRISQTDNRDRDIPPRESRLVDFPTFSAGDQDPIEWLESFEQACTANNVRNERMVSIAASYLKGTAITWFKQSGIRNWNTPMDPDRSFVHKFKRQYCSTFRRAQWTQKLRNHKQKPGDTVEKYVSELYELWHRIDPYNIRSEIDKIQEFIEGLRPEFIIHVQGMMPETVDQAVQKAKSIEIALSMNTGLSEYSLNNNYLKRTEGGSVPLKYNSKTSEESEIERLVEEKLRKRLGNMPNNNRNNQNRNVIRCHNCGKEGHKARECNKN